MCLDMLRVRTARREDALDARLPNPVVTYGDESDPEAEALLADSVGLALLVVLETLTPAERLAFVLHDMFAVPFEEIARMLGRSPDATKMMASRARRRVRGAVPAQDADTARRRTVADIAASDGDSAEIAEIAGPREEDLAQLATMLVARRRTPVKVLLVRNPADPDADMQATGGLLPGPGAWLAGPTFEEWLDQQ